MSDPTSATRNRPLSPHLTAYNPEIGSATSIFHRASGIVLSLGICLLAWWVVAVSMGGGAYAWTAWALGSILGRLFLFGWSVALSFHLLNGLRHLAWDADLGFGLATARRSGWIVLWLTLVLTAAFWLLVWVF